MCSTKRCTSSVRTRAVDRLEGTRQRQADPQGDDERGIEPPPRFETTDRDLTHARAPRQLDLGEAEELAHPAHMPPEPGHPLLPQSVRRRLAIARGAPHPFRSRVSVMVLLADDSPPNQIAGKYPFIQCRSVDRFGAAPHSDRSRRTAFEKPQAPPIICRVRSSRRDSSGAQARRPNQCRAYAPETDYLVGHGRPVGSCPRTGRPRTAVSAVWWSSSCSWSVRRTRPGTRWCTVCRPSRTPGRRSDRTHTRLHPLESAHAARHAFAYCLPSEQDTGS